MGEETKISKRVSYSIDPMNHQLQITVDHIRDSLGFTLAFFLPWTEI